VHEHTKTAVFGHTGETDLIEAEDEGLLSRLVDVVLDAVDISWHDLYGLVILDNGGYRSLPED
jgi:hypothetical protein